MDYLCLVNQRRNADYAGHGANLKLPDGRGCTLELVYAFIIELDWEVIMHFRKTNHRFTICVVLLVIFGGCNSSYYGGAPE
jgi:hypothetical protein